METYIVTAKKLNKRKFPVNDFSDKSNIAGQVLKDFTFQGEEATGLSNALGKWIRDRDGYYYWGGGVMAVKQDNNQNMKTSDVTKYPWWISDFGIDEIWKSTKGEGVTVFTLDTGFRKTNSLPISNISTRSVFKTQDNKEDSGEDEDGHGTLMASIIAGNGDVISGVAPGCELIAIKVFKDKTKQIQEENDNNNWVNFIEGLVLVEKIMTIDNDRYYIINCSCSGDDASDDIKSRIQTIINRINSKFNALFICAVGNDGDYVRPNPIPARLKNIITVAGFKKDGTHYFRLENSNYWPEINITCPGNFDINQPKLFEVLDVFPNLKNEFSGSSHACAYTTGLTALYLSQFKPKAEIIDKVKMWFENNHLFEERNLTIEGLDIELKYRIPIKDKFKLNFPQSNS
jgi:subtilisin family serine protease